MKKHIDTESLKTKCARDCCTRVQKDTHTHTQATLRLQLSFLFTTRQGTRLHSNEVSSSSTTDYLRKFVVCQRESVLVSNLILLLHHCNQIRKVTAFAIGCYCVCKTALTSYLQNRLFLLSLPVIDS